MEVKHTATPWHCKELHGQSRGYALFWIDESKPGKWARRVDQFANVGPNGEFTKEDAEFIVRAANAHEDLVKALQEITEIAESVDSWESFPSGPIERARAALAKAGA